MDAVDLEVMKMELTHKIEGFEELSPWCRLRRSHTGVVDPYGFCNDVSIHELFTII